MCKARADSTPFSLKLSNESGAPAAQTLERGRHIHFKLFPQDSGRQRRQKDFHYRASAHLALLDQTLDFGGIASRSLVLFGHGQSLTFSFGIAASSANHYQSS